MSQPIKKEKAVQRLMAEIQAKYPDTKLINYHSSPENPETLWLNITAPTNDDAEIELREFASDKAMDILLDMDCHILIMTSANGIT